MSKLHCARCINLKYVKKDGILICKRYGKPFEQINACSKKKNVNSMTRDELTSEIAITQWLLTTLQTSQTKQTVEACKQKQIECLSKKLDALKAAKKLK